MSKPPSRPARPDRRLPVRPASALGAAIGCLLLLLSAVPAAAQQADTTTAAPDTLRAAPAAPAPQTRTPGRLKEPVKFAARDSLVLHLDDPAGDRGQLHGDAKVTYGEAGLDAYRIDILFTLDELRASGLVSDTGMVGRPAFTQGGDTFRGDALAFNLRTERGRVVAAQTAIQDGFIRAGVVKVTQDSTLYVADGSYTTCECGPNETPSYSLRADKMKVVDGEWIYTGPIRLYLFNIPTPLWLPFGFLPAREGRRSGPLPPQYGEDERGFYLREWGWYQAISEYMDAQIQFGFWTKGSWEVNPLVRYARRYRYTGQLEVDYVRNRRGETGDPDQQIFSTSALRWSHNQTISPTASFNSNVNLSSQNYLRTISDQYDDRVRPTVQSSINYNKRWPTSGRSVSLNLSQQQALATGQTNLTLPSLSFSQSARKPFARERRPAGSDERWYEKITYSYNSSLANQFNYTPLPDSADRYPWYDVLFSPSAYRAATGRSDTPFNVRATHRVNSNASFTMNRLPLLDTPFILNVSPNASYSEDWFIETTRRVVTADSQVVSQAQPEFFALRQFNTSLSANTTFYGLFPVRLGAYQGLRHTVRPSLSFTFQPDFYADGWGYTDRYVDPQTGQTVTYGLVPGVTQGRQQSLSLSLGNVFETKRVQTDTTGQARSQAIQLLYLDLSSSYNFAADSFKLAPVFASARTRLFEKLDLRASATFSPYGLDPTTGRQLPGYLFRDPGFRFARLTDLSINLGTSFQSTRRTGGEIATTPRAQFAAPVPANPADPLYGSPYDPIYGGPGYADFAIPWSLRLDFSYGYTESRGPYTSRPRATVNSSFDFNLTPKWKVQGRSGYDFVQGEVVSTDLTILRDLGCWEMSFRWVPFGRYQSYGFDLHVKSGHLRDLLRLRQPKSDVRGRFGSLLN